MRISRGASIYSAPLYVVMMVLGVTLPHVYRSLLRIMGLGATFGALLAGPLQQVLFFWRWIFCAVGNVNFPHKKVHVVPPTFDQIQFRAGAHFGLLVGP